MKYIKATPEILSSRLNEFEEKVKSFKEKLVNNGTGVISSESFSYTAPSAYEISAELKKSIVTPKICMKASVYCKMMQYVLLYDMEIAWQGSVTKHHESVYEITEVYLYPQLNRATYVETQDEETMNKWEATLTDEQYLSKRFQGHSHVNMGVSPSGTDLNQQKEFISDSLQYLREELSEEEFDSANPFYIFVIANKKQSFNWFLYDFKRNILFENEDIELIVDYGNDFTNQSLKDEISLYTKDNTSYYLKPNVTPITSKTFKDEWEIRCTSLKALEDLKETKFYKSNKDLLIIEQDLASDIFFVFPITYLNHKLENDFIVFKKSEYPKIRGVFIQQSQRIGYKPNNSKKKKDPLLKLDNKLVDMYNEDKIPYMLVGTKMDKIQNINEKYNYELYKASELMEITFSQGDTYECLTFPDPEKITETILEAIQELTAAGLALKGVKLKKND